MTVRLHPQVQRWVDEQTEPCEFCTSRGRPMKPPEVLAPGWYHAHPIDSTGVEWHLHDPAGCRARRPEDATTWVWSAFPTRSLETV